MTIIRLWHGWTSCDHADAYQEHFLGAVLAELHRIPGFQGGRLLRRQEGDEVAFVTMTCFASLDAIRAFAGEAYEEARIAPEVKPLLSRFDRHCEHYEVVAGQ